MEKSKGSHFFAFVKKIFAPSSKNKITEEGLRHALLEGEKAGLVESRERTMVEGVFYLGDRPVSAFMTHRSSVKWLDINADTETALKAAREAGGQACFPVADGNLDKVVGAVLVQEIYRALLDYRSGLSGAQIGGSWPGLKPIMRQPHFIPETMPALKAFEAFKKADANDIFVMDEYGGFAGLLTVRNLVEEIVGELSASGEKEDAIARQEDGTWLADGGVSIDDAARELRLERLGEEQNEYHTLAGFILYLAGEIPREGACFDYGGYRFKVVDMDHNRIDKVMVSKRE